MLKGSSATRYGGLQQFQPKPQTTLDHVYCPRLRYKIDETTNEAKVLKCSRYGKSTECVPRVPDCLIVIAMKRTKQPTKVKNSQKGTKKYKSTWRLNMVWQKMLTKLARLG